MAGEQQLQKMEVTSKCMAILVILATLFGSLRILRYSVRSGPCLPVLLGEL